MTTKTAGLPPLSRTWDVSQIFPSIESDEFSAALTEAAADVKALSTLIEKLDNVDVFEKVTHALNSARTKVGVLSSYISAFTSTDTSNMAAQAASAQLRPLSSELSRIANKYEKWIGSVDPSELTSRSVVAADHEFALRKIHNSSGHQMPAAEEDLASALGSVGGAAWASLYRNITSSLQVHLDGKTLPLPATRGLMRHPDPALRQAAFEGELQAWKSVELPLTAAINGVKGQQIILSARRGWESLLHQSYASNNVTAGIVESMQAACIETFPDFHRYFKIKARVLGKSDLAWWDLLAPLASEQTSMDYQQAAEAVVGAFYGYSEKMGDFARRGFTESWVDVDPRDGKLDGAFCMGIGGGDSRIFTNWTPAFGVYSLAHEFGHAYHGLCLAHRTPLQRSTPMALSETASIFCQVLTLNTLLKDAGPLARLSLLETDIQSAMHNVVEIHSRFLFDKAFVDRRASRELSVDETKQIMLDAQLATFGEGISPLHPYMWAARPHFFGGSFNNWPYTFGLLFVYALHRQYAADPESFREGYDALLSRTGMEDTVTLGRRFVADFESIEFWRSSLSHVRSRIDEFEAAANNLSGSI